MKITEGKFEEYLKMYKHEFLTDEEVKSIEDITDIKEYDHLEVKSSHRNFFLKPTKIYCKDLEIHIIKVEDNWFLVSHTDVWKNFEHQVEDYYRFDGIENVIDFVKSEQLKLDKIYNITPFKDDN